MRRKVFPGVLIAILGLMIALVPVRIFPTCVSAMDVVAGSMPMKCYWSGQVEIGIGILIFFGGIFLMAFESAFAKIGVSAMTALIGVFAFLIPNKIICGCEMSTMPCQMFTFPALSVLSILTVIICAAYIIYLGNRSKSELNNDGI